LNLRQNLLFGLCNVAESIVRSYFSSNDKWHDKVVFTLS